MNPQTVLVVAALLALAVTASRWVFARRGLPSWAQPLAQSGVLVIGAGALAGPLGLNLFTSDTLRHLGPLITIGLGWIGFLFGSHFEWRLLRRYPTTLYAAALMEALVSFAVVAPVAWWLLGLWPDPEISGPGRAAAATILGICASGTAPAGAFLVSSRWRVAHGNLNALRFFAAVDDMPALCLLGALRALSHPGLGGPQLEAGAWLAITLGLGVMLGVVAHWVFPGRDDSRQNSLILLGVISLGAGTAAHLQISPLFVTALAGITFANLSHQKESAYGLLAEREHTLYVVFLLVAGVLFRFEWTPILVWVPLYVLVRALGKVVGGWVGWRLFLGKKSISPLIGAGLLFQGGMALAIAVSLDHTQGAAGAPQVTTTIVMAVVVNELIAPVVAGRLLGRGRAP